MDGALDRASQKTHDMINAGIERTPESLWEYDSGETVEYNGNDVGLEGEYQVQRAFPFVSGNSVYALLEEDEIIGYTSGEKLK